MKGKVGIIGGGIMGCGIALLALQHGHAVCIVDNATDVLTTARNSIDKQLTRLVEKNKLTAAGTNIQD